MSTTPPTPPADAKGKTEPTITKTSGQFVALQVTKDDGFKFLGCFATTEQAEAAGRERLAKVRGEVLIIPTPVTVLSTGKGGLVWA